MNEKICGIYMILNIQNNKCYIGQSIDILKRWGEHKRSLNNGNHCNIHLQRAWNKYGEHNFVFNIIEKCNYSDVNLREEEYIKLYKSYDIRYGYNMTFGGEGNIPTDEVRKKKSIQFSGQNNPMYGKCGELSPSFGIKRSNETKRKISESKRGCAGLVGANNPMYGRVGSSNPASHKVVCMNTGFVFNTLKDAAEWCGLSGTSCITMACNGSRKSAGKHPDTGEKLCWKYIEDITNHYENNEFVV